MGGEGRADTLFSASPPTSPRCVGSLGAESGVIVEDHAVWSGDRVGAGVRTAAVEEENVNSPTLPQCPHLSHCSVEGHWLVILEKGDYSILLKSTIDGLMHNLYS